MFTVCTQETDYKYVLVTNALYNFEVMSYSMTHYWNANKYN